MDIRKALARMGPPPASLEPGSGGRPELPSYDLAAALGMMDDRLARDVLCALWWPQAPAALSAAVDRTVRDAQMQEWLAQRKTLETAKLALYIAQDDADAGRAPSAFHRTRLRQARSELEAVKAQQWPGIGPIYRSLRQAVLAELAQPQLCEACAGQGRPATGLPAACPECRGTGRKAVSDRKRAGLIGRDEAAYRRVWRPVYEWTLALCADAEIRGARALERLLGLSAGQAAAATRHPPPRAQTPTAEEALPASSA